MIKKFNEHKIKIFLIYKKDKKIIGEKNII